MKFAKASGSIIVLLGWSTLVCYAITIRYSPQTYDRDVAILKLAVSSMTIGLVLACIGCAFDRERR
jgi:hypothetical protein